MNDYIDNLIYTSSNNGNTKKFNLKDTQLRSSINDTNETINTFFNKAKHGFGSNYSANDIIFQTVSNFTRP